MPWKEEALLDRLNRRTKIDPITNCWLWIGATQKSGHGHLYYKGRTVGIHRLSAHLYLSLNLASSVYACHKEICPNSNCWNPEHLYLGTAKDNAADMIRLKRHRNSRKTHCPRGHEFTMDNIILHKNGARECRKCHYKPNREVGDICV